MKIRTSFWLVFFLVWKLTSISQSVGVGTNTPHSSAQLDVNSTTKGTLITTMSSAQRKAISNPALGLLVFDIDKKTIYMFDGTQWLPFLFSVTEKNPPTYAQAQPSILNQNFGYKVAIYEDYAVIAANNGSAPGVPNSGRAYIFFRDNGVWKMQDILMANDAATGDDFGASVSINANYAIIGAPGADVNGDNNRGSVYVFSRTGTAWSQQNKITASDGQPNDFFGRAVSINNDNFLAIGANGDDIGGNSNQGSAYIFKGTAGIGGFIWTLQAKLTASDGDAGDNLGFSIAMSGSFVIAGAYGDDIGVNIDQGSVYSFYEFTNPAGWTSGQAYHQKITAADGDGSDFFGISVDINFNRLIVGASGDDIGPNPDQGSAYLYFRLGIPPFLWTAPEKITAADGAPNDNFGISVAVSTTHAVVGAYRSGDEAGIINPGSFYIYSGFNLVFSRKVADDVPDTNGYFGFSVAIFAYDILVGAYGKNNNAGQIAFLNVQ
jgi:hypothetical protein